MSRLLLLGKLRKKRTTLATLLSKYGTNAHAWLPGAGVVSVIGDELGAGATLSSLRATLSSTTAPSTATCNSAGNFGFTNANIAPANKTHMVVVAWSANSAGRSLRIELGDQLVTVGTAVSGSITSYLKSGTTGAFYFYGVSGAVSDTLRIDSLSIKEVTYATSTVSGLPTNNYLLSDASTGYSSTDSVVGLALDAMGSVGARLETNGDFDTDTAWTKEAGWTISGGKANFSNPTATNIYQSVLTSTKTYKATIVISSVTSGNVAIRIGSSFSSYFTAAGTYEFIAVAGSALAGISCANGGIATVASIDSFSVREITGIHASQSTNNNKPMLRLNSGKYSWSFDGSNDSLLTGNLGITDTVTVVIAGKVNSLSAIQVLLYEDIGGVGIYLSAAGAILFSKVGAGPYVSSSAGTIVAGVPFVITARLQVGAAAIRNLGTQIATAPSALVFSATKGARIGTGFSGTTDPLNGSIYSVNVIAATTTDADCLAIERLVAQQAGITI